MRSINSKGLNLIKNFEGLRLKAYKPVSTEKFWTIGYGHSGPEIKQGQVISQEEAERLLKNDLKRFEKQVEENVKIKLNDNQFSALVSFCYNAGLGNLLKLIKNRNTSQIAAAIPLYNKGGGKVLAGLVRRRTAEKNLFIS